MIQRTGAVLRESKPGFSPWAEDGHCSCRDVTYRRAWRCTGNRQKTSQSKEIVFQVHRVELGNSQPRNAGGLQDDDHSQDNWACASVREVAFLWVQCWDGLPRSHLSLLQEHAPDVKACFSAVPLWACALPKGQWQVRSFLHIDVPWDGKYTHFPLPEKGKSLPWKWFPMVFLVCSLCDNRVCGDYSFLLTCKGTHNCQGEEIGFSIFNSSVDLICLFGSHSSWRRLSIPQVPD